MSIAHLFLTVYRGVELKLARGGKNYLGLRARARPGHDFAPVWANFFNFSLYIVRMNRSSGVEKLLLPPPVIRPFPI